MALSAEIPILIDKQDTVEQVRDQIACILAIESANQVALATTAQKPDPNEWALSVYMERSNPFEVWLNNPTAAEKVTPIVNVFFDTETFDLASSNRRERQKSDATFNIDVYGYGEAEDDGNGGFKAGDENAARASQRGVRLCRNILMSPIYMYLKLQGLVGGRWTRSITQFQPELDGQAVQNIIGTRIAFTAEFNEFSPEKEFETLGLLSVLVKRAEDGKIVIEADYDYTI